MPLSSKVSRPNSEARHKENKKPKFFIPSKVQNKPQAKQGASSIENRALSVLDENVLNSQTLLPKNNTVRKREEDYIDDALEGNPSEIISNEKLRESPIPFPNCTEKDMTISKGEKVLSEMNSKEFSTFSMNPSIASKLQMLKKMVTRNANLGEGTTKELK